MKPLYLTGLLCLQICFVYGQSGQSFYYFYRPNQPMFVNAQTFGIQPQEQTSYSPTSATFRADYQNPGISIAPTRIQEQTAATSYSPQIPINQGGHLFEKITFSNQPRRVDSTAVPTGGYQSFFDQPFQYFHQKSANEIPQQQQFYTPQPTVYQPQLPLGVPTTASTTRPFFNYHRLVQPTVRTDSETNEFVPRRKSVSLTQVHTDPISYEVQQYYSTVHNNQGKTGYSYAIGTDKNANPTASVNVNLGPSVFANDGEPYEGHTQRLRAISGTRRELYSYNNAQNLDKIEQDEMEKMELQKIAKIEQEQEQEQYMDKIPPATTTAITETSSVFSTNTVDNIITPPNESGLGSPTEQPLKYNTDSITIPKRLQKSKKIARKRIRVRGRNKTSTITKKDRDEPFVTTEESLAVPPQVTTVISISTTTEEVVTTTVASRRPTQPPLRRRLKTTPALTTTTTTTSTTTEPPTTTVDISTIKPSPVMTVTDIINSFPQPSTKIRILPSRISTTTESSVEVIPDIVNDPVPIQEEPVIRIESTTTERQTTKKPEIVTMPPASEEYANYPSEEEYGDYEIEYQEKSNEETDEVSSTTFSSVPTTTPTTTTTSTTTPRATTTTTAPRRRTTTTPTTTTTTTPTTTTTTPTTTTTTSTMPPEIQSSTSPAIYDATEPSTERTYKVISQRRKKILVPEPVVTTENYFSAEPLYTTEKPVEQETISSTSTEKILEEEIKSLDDGIEFTTVVEHLVPATINTMVETTSTPFESISVTEEQESTTASSTSTTTTTTEEVNAADETVDYDNMKAPVPKEVSLTDISDEMEAVSVLNETATTVSSTTEKMVEKPAENELDVSSEDPFYSDEYDGELPTESEEKIGQAQRLALDNALKNLRERMKNSTTEAPTEISSTESNENSTTAARKFIRKTPTKISQFPNSNDNRANYNNNEGDEEDKQSRSQIVQKIQKFRSQFVRVHSYSKETSTTNPRSTTKRPRRVTRPSARLFLNQVQLVDGKESSINTNSKSSSGGSRFFGSSRSSGVTENSKSQYESAGVREVTIAPQPPSTTTATTTTTSKTTTPQPSTSSISSINLFDNSEEIRVSEVAPEDNLKYENEEKQVQSKEPNNADFTTEPIISINTPSTITEVTEPQITTTTTEEIISSTTQTERPNERTLDKPEETEEIISSTTEITTAKIEKVNSEEAVEPQIEDKPVEQEPEKQSDAVTTEKITESVNKSEGDQAGKPKATTGERKGRVIKIKRKIISHPKLIIHEILPTPKPAPTTTTTTTTTTTPEPSHEESVAQFPGTGSRVRRLRKKIKKDPEINVPLEDFKSTTETINFHGVTQGILNSTSVVISSLDDEENIIFTTSIPSAENGALQNFASYEESLEKSPSTQRKVRRVLKKRKLLPPPPA